MKKILSILMVKLLIVTLSISPVIWAESEQEKEQSEENKWDVNHPPGESYLADIDVTEGTWMNVDVSPDGKNILFDLLGDIYIMPIDGGEAKALTHTIAWEMQATFSPDGKRIAFTSDQGGWR